MKVRKVDGEIQDNEERFGLMLDQLYRNETGMKSLTVHCENVTRNEAQQQAQFVATRLVETMIGFITVFHTYVFHSYHIRAPISHFI